ncbi:transposase [Dactylosporangium sp. CA-139066]|uniref:transposase n=1 Tax=Dactylosporangium sp. CA-139066 TaxID=3239930 RepID=UPI003D8EF337
MDTETRLVRRGRVAPADRELLRGWLGSVTGRPAVFAVEACTGWRFVVEELQRAGMRARFAEPADTAAARGPKRRAKTDRTDARRLRELLAEDRLPESWIAPLHVLEMRGLLQLFKDLHDAHTGWVQRIHAMLFHQGVAAAGDLLSREQRQRLQAGVGLSPAGHQAVLAALRMIDALDAELDPLRRQITDFARRQLGCAVLQRQYGVGPITAAVIWAELGDARRFSASRKAVRQSGLDVTVYSSDDKRAAGHLSRQGWPLLRWALYEAAKCAARTGSPDHAYYARVKDRIGVTGRRCRWPEDHPAVLPSAALARRPGPGHGVSRCWCAPLPTCRCLAARSQQAPCHGAVRRHGLERPSGCTPVLRDTLSIIMSPNPARHVSSGFAHRDKAGRPRTTTQPRHGSIYGLTTIPGYTTVCAGAHRRQGRTSSLRCGRSTLTPAAPDATSVPAPGGTENMRTRTHSTRGVPNR